MITGPMIKWAQYGMGKIERENEIQDVLRILKIK
jgi:hypothetical protein